VSVCVVRFEIRGDAGGGGSSEAQCSGMPTASCIPC
jgi:hypothetical protein